MKGLFALSKHVKVLLKQESRNLRLKEGDGSIITKEGVLKSIIISYYENFLVNFSHTRISYERCAFLFCEDVNALIFFPPLQISYILGVLKGLEDFEASGLDGFNSLFYKCARHIIGQDIEEVVPDFLS